MRTYQSQNSGANGGGMREEHGSSFIQAPPLQKVQIVGGGVPMDLMMVPLLGG